MNKFIKYIGQLIVSTSNAISTLATSLEDFTLKHLLRFVICAREICKKFVYKHLETIEYVKN